jgi:hypothetical protein
MNFHREYVIDEDIYGEPKSLTVEQMKKIMDGITSTQLDILKFSMYPPGCSKEFREELDSK